jgi:hypothetical protein
MRMYPIHFDADMETKGFDLALARLYLPPDAPVVLERGRASSKLSITLDARDGVRANGTGEIEDVVLMRPGERDPAAIIPKVTLAVSDFVSRNDQLEVGRFELAGSASVRDPTTARGGRLQVSTSGQHPRRDMADHSFLVVSTSRAPCQAAER